MGWDPFSGCNSLTSIIIEEENLVYDSRNDCNAIIETATNTLVTGCMGSTIPNGITSIAPAAFYSNKGLATITIPESVNTIGDCAFENCTSLESVYFEQTVAPSFGNYCFTKYSRSGYNVLFQEF